MSDDDKKDLQQSLESLRQRVEVLEAQVKQDVREDRLSLLIFSGSLDQILAAFVVASTAAASGMDVQMFFTFWALGALRDEKKRGKKDLLGRLFGWMVPKGHNKLPLSQWNMGGLGAAMIKQIMAKKRHASIDEMLEICSEFGVKISICDMSRDVMGITLDELIDYPHLTNCGATTFLESAAKGKITMFI